MGGGTFDNLEIIIPTEIPDDVAIVIASEAYYSEIMLGLMRQGIKNKIYAIIFGEFVKCYPTPALEGWTYEYPKVEPVPITLNASLSGLCNSKCRYCSFHSEYNHKKYFEQGFMNEKILEQLVRQIDSIRTFKILRLYGFGEPMLHPDWEKYAARLIEAGSFETVEISTNGMLLTEENAIKIKNLPIEHISLNISIDGLSAEDCEYWRKGEIFSVIQKNIRRAYEILNQRVAMTIASCVVLPSTVRADSYEEVVHVLRESEVWKRKEFPFAAISTGLAAPNASIPGTKVVKAAILPRPIYCGFPFQEIMVNNNGDIAACVCGHDMYMSMKGAIIGNIMKDSLLDTFYHNEVLEQIRKDFHAGKSPKICGTCLRCRDNSVLCLQREK